MNFTISVIPRTKKNSQQIFFRNGKVIAIPSKKYKEFEEECLWLIPSKYKKKIDYPVNIKVTYYVQSNRRIDKTNLESAVMDMLVKVGVLADDSAINPRIAVGHDGSRVYVDKDNPRIEIEITKLDE